MPGSTSDRGDAGARAARVLRALACLALVAGGGCGEPARPPVRNVVLVSIDTLRADRLGAYGHERPTSPELDAFAARGVVFEDASSTSSWTLPSHASMLTGLYPAQVGVRRRNDSVDPDVPTLAERMREAGFRTVGFANCVFFKPGPGLSRGYDVWRLYPEVQGPAGAATRMTRDVLSVLEAARDERIFLFVHYFDVHMEYASRPEIERSFLAGLEVGEIDRSLELVGRVHGGEPLAPDELEALSRLYDAGIRQLDVELGKLLRWIEANLGWEETLVIVTSDHGEAFLEHGYLSHGFDLYQEVLHVPLVVFGGGVPAGVRIGDPVSIVDVVPTALAAAGLPAPERTAGVDLALYWDETRPAPSDRVILAQAAPGIDDDVIRMLRRGDHKLIENLETGRRELYDLAADPGERRDLGAARPARVAELDAALDAFQARYPDTGRGEPVETDPDTEERLRALGYLD